MNISMLTSVPLTPPWDQGDKNLAYALTTALPAHRFRILTTGNGRVPVGANLAPQPIFRHGRPSLMEKARVYAWLLTQSARLGSNRRDAPDLYHLVYRPYTLSSWLCQWLPEFKRRPTIHTVPATADGRPLHRALFFADRLVALSQYGQRALQGLGFSNVAYIPPGVDTERWANLDVASARAALGLGEHPVILFPGHYGAGYGAEVMSRALAQIAAAVPEVRVVFACRPRTHDDRERERAARETIAQRGLAHCVRFYNTVPDMQPLIGASDLVVLPLETMRDKMDLPLTLLEALAARKAVVISDLAPMNELLQNGAGLAVPPGDAVALARACVALLQDTPAREGLGARGQALARAYFDIHRVAAQYERLYREMVK